ncbi:hypothetical protein [Desulfosarcina sp.]|uniref:hypothetical protein n=1 Tax=Desulfosarcina sp. TaxID=2027861 RepID=UPI003970DF64
MTESLHAPILIQVMAAFDRSTLFVKPDCLVNLAVAVQIRRLLIWFSIPKSLPDIHPPVACCIARNKPRLTRLVLINGIHATIAGCIPPPFQWTLFTVKCQNADNFAMLIQTVTGRCFSVCQQVPFINTAIGIRVALNPFDSLTLVILKGVHFQIAVGVRLEFNDVPGWSQMRDPIRFAVVIRILFYDPAAGYGRCRVKNTPNQQIHAENEHGRMPIRIPQGPGKYSQQMLLPKRPKKKATKTGRLL